MDGRNDLTGVERYRLWQWIEEHADEVRGGTDKDAAAAASAELDRAYTEHHIGYARRELGIVKRPKTQAAAPGVTRDELRELAAFCVTLGERTGTVRPSTIIRLACEE